MAYNPFNIFRRNQKAIFAVVTVIIMFVFVLSSGLGGGADFFDWLPRWLGRGGPKGDEICKIDGTRIYGRDLDTLRRNRAMANQFMLRAAAEASNSITQYQEGLLAQVDPDTKKLFNQAMGAMFQLGNRNQLLSQFGPEGASFMMQQYRRMIDECYRRASEANAKQAEKDFVRAMMYQETLGDLFMFSRGQQYFLSAPNRTASDNINFMLWLKKADELGINFVETDVYKLINHEFQGYFTSDVPVRRSMQKEYGPLFNIDAVIKSIGEEYRVRAAQLAVLGPGLVNLSRDKTFSGTTIFATPYEYFEFYKNECSPTDYGVIPVPVDAFLDKVTGQPTEDELRKLYDEYKNLEPSPERETPGFRTPRLMKLEWVSATGEEPYYQKQAEESLKAGELQAKIGTLFTVPLPGMGPAWVVAATTPLMLKDPLLDIDSVRSEYDTSIKAPHNAALNSDWTQPAPILGSIKILDTSVVRPGTLAAALGGCIGGSMTGAGPLTGISCFEVAARSYELRDRIRAQAPMVLGAVPVPGMLPDLIAGEAALRTLLPKPLPIDVDRPELIKHLTEKTARQLMLADMKSFTTKVADLAEGKPIDTDTDKKAEEKKPGEKKPEEKKPAPKKTPAELKAEVEKFIADYAAKRGWKRGGSRTLDSEWTMEDDPGLAPLRQAAEEFLAKSGHKNIPIHFGRSFFWRGDQRTGQRVAIGGLFKPEDFPAPPNPNESPAAKPEPVYLVWRTEETKSKEAEGFAAPAMQQQLRAAWKHIKARDIAKERAEAIANAVRSSPGDTQDLIMQTLNGQAKELSAQIANPKIREQVKVFTINNVCPLAPTAPAAGDNPFAPGGLAPFQIRPTSDIPFPDAAMKDTLLAERTKPPKTTFLLTDRPRDTYYVVTVEVRKLKTVGEFELSVYTEFPTDNRMSFLAQTRQAVRSAFDLEEQKQTIESVMGLLKKEFKFEITDDEKKKLEESDKRGTLE